MTRSLRIGGPTGTAVLILATVTTVASFVCAQEAPMPAAADASAASSPAGTETPGRPRSVSDTSVPMEAASSTGTGVPIEAVAERMRYDRKTGTVYGEGNVVIEYGDTRLTADEVRVNRDSGQCLAEGNVELSRGGQVWRGDRVEYNFRTGEVRGGRYTAYQDPFYVYGGAAQRRDDGVWVLHDAAITTCDLSRPHYYILAKEVEMYPGDRLVARNVQFVLWDRAFFWLPTATWSLDDDRSKFEFVPGYSSDFGAYLLTAYNGVLGEIARYTLHLDYRQKRGLAGGVDLDYENETIGSGRVLTYYASDNEPMDDEDIAAGRDIDSDRYRLRLDHSVDFGPNTYGLLRLNRQSDEDVIADFFEEEYRREVQPDSFGSVTHLGDAYTFTALGRVKLNSFFNVVERLPELSFDLRRMQIGDTPFYYDTETSAGLLDADFADGSAEEDYDSGRFDTVHEISIPRKLFGWLSVIPRIQGRATYYDTGLERYEETVPFEDEDGMLGEETILVQEETGSQTRWLVSPGINTFFKAFRIWDVQDERWGVNGLRHVVEPSANYYYTNDPSVTPDKIPQFDSIDELDGQNFIRLGLRNKLQTKRRDASYDLVDFYFGSDLRIDPRDEEEDFGDLLGDLELRLFDSLWADFDTRFDMYQPEFREFNSQIRTYAGEDWDARLSHRYRIDSHNLVATDLRYTLNDRWAVRAYDRVDADMGRMEEQEYTVYRDLHCWTSALSFRVRSPLDGDDEYQVWVVFTLKAFPNRAISIGR